MSNNKEALRLYWKKQLLQISLERRKKAVNALINHPLPEGITASFASFQEEIDTHSLNRLLAQRKLLVLPRVENDHLVFYHVNHLETQLDLSASGILEPIPSLCKVATQIDIILVPGLAFDKEHYRLGYGKGYYDRVLASSLALAIGIGFKEQLTDMLPHESHDVKLSQLCLL